MARSSSKIANRKMLDVIGRVIRPSYISGIQDVMVEKKTYGRKGRMECKICTHHEEVLLCSFDRKDENYKTFPYFLEVDGMVSMCDYCLFVEDSTGLYVFSVELKDSTNGPKKQTLRGKVFAEFIINRIRAIKGEKAFPKEVHYGQVGIKTTCEKMTTKGYDEMGFDDDGYILWPDYHSLYTRRLIDLL